MKKTTTIAFTGDIGFDKYMSGKWADETLVSSEVLAFLKSADHVVANVEGALSKGEQQAKANSVVSLMHSMDPEATTFLRRINADIWNICNNHIMDAGADGMADTLREAAAFGARTLGAGMNIEEASQALILNEAGGIGLIGVGYQRGCRKADEVTPGCFSWSDMDRIRERIAEVKSSCRWCVIVAHGGEEFTALPTCYTRDRYLEYLNMGADIVVCHHPHVPMNYELVGNKAIFYSLGNFVFDTDYQRSQFNTEKGVLLKVSFDEEKFSFEPMGLFIDRENEKIVKGELPRIFVNVEKEQYRLLEPLAAKMFVAATKRQQMYLNPDKFKNFTEEDWHEHFYEEKRSGRVPGEALDFQIVVPIAARAEDEEWKKSTLEGVKEYILEQM